MQLTYFQFVKSTPVAYPGFHHGRERSAVDAEGVGCGEGVSPPHWGGVWGGTVPPPQFLVFWGENAVFQRISNTTKIFLPRQWGVLSPLTPRYATVHN